MKYAQLSKAAKKRAREWFKESESEMWGSDRAPDYYEDMAVCLKFLGITVSKSTEKWRNSTTGREGSTEKYDFEWSGFWSQGDGLVFEGSWDASDVDMAGLTAHAPEDTTLHRIAVQMTAMLLRWPQSHATITTVSHGPGLPSMHIEGSATGIADATGDEPELPEEDVVTLNEQVFAAAHWCYKHLEDSYEYDTSDEAAVESIEANEYDFDRDGEFVPHRRQRVAATDCPGAAA